MNEIVKKNEVIRGKRWSVCCSVSACKYDKALLLTYNTQFLDCLIILSYKLSYNQCNKLTINHRKTNLELQG